MTTGVECFQATRYAADFLFVGILKGCAQIASGAADHYDVSDPGNKGMRRNARWVFLLLNDNNVIHVVEHTPLSMNQKPASN